MAKVWQPRNMENVVEDVVDEKDTPKPPKLEETPKQKTEEPKVSQDSSQPLVLVSETDAYIHERMKSQPRSLEEVPIEIRENTDTLHVLRLPRELDKFSKDYSFRWLNKKKRSIDHALDVIGWTLANKVIFKDLPKHLFTANGSIERGDAILAFMPRRRAEAIRLRPAQISRERVRNTPVQELSRWEDRGEKYYKPDIGAAESDTEKARGISVTPDTDITETEQ